MAWGEQAQIAVDREIDPPKGPGGNPKVDRRSTTGSNFMRCLPDQATSLSQLMSNRTHYLSNCVALRHPRRRRSGAHLCQAEWQQHSYEKRRRAGKQDGLGSVGCSAGMHGSNCADDHSCGSTASSSGNCGQSLGCDAAASSHTWKTIGGSMSRSLAVASSCSSSNLGTGSCLKAARLLRLETPNQVSPSMQSGIESNADRTWQGHVCRVVAGKGGLCCSHQSSSGSCAAGAPVQRNLQSKLQRTCFSYGRRLKQGHLGQLASCLNMPLLHQLPAQRYNQNVPVAGRLGQRQLTRSMAVW